jgi:hypothetical protein
LGHKIGKSSSKMKADVDTLLVEGVESLEKYLDEHEAARAKLKQVRCATRGALALAQN